MKLQVGDKVLFKSYSRWVEGTVIGVKRFTVVVKDDSYRVLFVAHRRLWWRMWKADQ